MTHCLFLAFSLQRYCQFSQKPSQNRPNNVRQSVVHWQRYRYQAFQYRSACRIWWCKFALGSPLILEEKASCLGFFDWIRYSADYFEASLDWLICAKIGWCGAYCHFFHGGLITRNHGLHEITGLQLMPSPAEPIELLLLGGLVFSLFQSPAHVHFVCYHEPIISRRNQLF